MKERIQELKDILGEDNVLADEKDIQGYETPWRGIKGRAAFVVRPKDTSEVSKTLNYFNKHQISFVAQSGNTGLVGASTPDQTGQQAILSLTRLNQSFAINLVNKSAHIGAGMHLSKLNEIAAEHNLFFPIDLSSDPCIGGMVATNTGGSRLLKYGDVRKNLLGLCVVLRDGTILKMNNTLHKNNTGLDIKQLFTGTGDKNGIITECIIKLSAQPKQSATALIIPTSNEAVPKLLSILEARFGDELSAFEGMSKNSIDAAFSYHGSSLKNSFKDGVPDYTCLIELNRTWHPRDGELTLETVLEDVLGDILESNENLIENVLFGRPSEHWELRHAISEAVQKSGHMVGFDISFERDKAMAFRTYMQQALSKNFENIKICDFGHIGDGAMHFNLVVPFNDMRLNDEMFILQLKEWVFERVVNDFDGSYSAEHGCGPSNYFAYEKYTNNTIQEIAKNIQRLLNLSPHPENY